MASMHPRSPVENVSSATGCMIAASDYKKELET
jgi:hypothetical protein